MLGSVRPRPGMLTPAVCNVPYRRLLSMTMPGKARPGSQLTCLGGGGFPNPGGLAPEHGFHLLSTMASPT